MFVGMNFSQISTLVVLSISQLFNPVSPRKICKIKNLMTLSGFTEAYNGKMEPFAAICFWRQIFAKHGPSRESCTIWMNANISLSNNYCRKLINRGTLYEFRSPGAGNPSNECHSWSNDSQQWVVRSYGIVSLTVLCARQAGTGVITVIYFTHCHKKNWVTTCIILGLCFENDRPTEMSADIPDGGVLLRGTNVYGGTWGSCFVSHVWPSVDTMVDSAGERSYH